MYLIELLISVCIFAVMSTGVYFSDLASEEYAVNCEAVRLAGALQEIQERSRSFHYMEDGDFIPSCRIYKDKYVLHRTLSDEETYYLPDGIKIDFYDTANFFVYRQKSLYGGVTNKTLRIYKNKTAKYILINRVGRIRINKLYAESE